MGFRTVAGRRRREIENLAGDRVALPAWHGRRAGSEYPGQWQRNLRQYGWGAVSAIATGGKRSTTINISLGALVDKLVFEGGYEGSRDDMQRDLENRLIQVLQMAATAQ